MFNIEKPDFNSKKDLYHELNISLKGLISDEPYWLPNISNAASLLHEFLSSINWAGFYLYKGGELVLGPFQGKPACIRIPLGKGVCGTAAKERKTQIVRNVHEFPGHIACDSASQSEIVIPMIKDGRLIGVLDIDSPVIGRFDEEDSLGLQEFADILNEYISWPDNF